MDCSNSVVHQIFPVFLIIVRYFFTSWSQVWPCMWCKLANEMKQIHHTLPLKQAARLHMSFDPSVWVLPKKIKIKTGLCEASVSPQQTLAWWRKKPCFKNNLRLRRDWDIYYRRITLILPTDMATVHRNFKSILLLSLSQEQRKTTKEF